MNLILFTLLAGLLPSNDTIVSAPIQEITVVGDYPKTLTLPLVVVTSKNLEASSFFTPADALQLEPGLAIARDGIWSTSVNIRGFGEQRILEMVDGDRIQTATEHSGPMSTIDLNFIDKIEVIKGAGSVLYGSGAMGGVVNYVTKTPVYTPFFTTKGNIGTGFNTVNSLWENFANAQFSNKNFYVGLNGSFRTAQNTLTPGGILPNSQFHDASWGIKAGVLYTPNQEFKANYQHFEGWDIGIPGGRTFPETAAARYTNISRNQLDGEYIISNLNDNLRQLAIKAYTQNISRDVELKPADPMVTMLPGSINSTSGVRAISEWIFPYQQLTIGAEGWLRNSNSIRYTDKTTGDSLLTVTVDLPTPHAKMYDGGVFAHYSWMVMPDRLTLEAGLRLDYTRIENDSVYNPLFRYNQANGSKSYIANLPRTLIYVASVNQNLNYAAHLDAIYAVSKKQSFTFSLSNSYRAPSIEELFKYINLGASIHLGNPTLKPEQGTFSDLNYTFAGNRFLIKTDIFANYLTNLIQEVQDAQNLNIYKNENISQALYVGAEIESRWLINNELGLMANASYTNARNLLANVYLPQIPPLHGFATFDYHPAKKIGGSLSALWAAKQAEVAPGEPTTDGHIIFNIDAHSPKIELNNTHLQLFAGVDNILNTAYFDHLSSTRGAIKLEPGRNIYLKVKWGW